MCRIRVVWLEVDAVYAFKSRGFGGEAGLVMRVQMKNVFRSRGKLNVRLRVN